MKASRSAWFALAVVPMILSWGALAQVTPPAAPAPQSQGQKLVTQGKHSEGLAALEGELKADPQNASLQVSKIDALMGLHRYREAAPIALKLAATSAEAKYMAGQCALAMGFPANAVQMWSGLYGDALWGGKAFEAAARALLAQGKEGDAKALLEKALTAVRDPSSGLVGLAMELGIKGAVFQSALESTAKGNPASAELLKVWTAAGGNVWVETPSQAGPIVVTLKEKSEDVNPSALRWSDSYVGIATSNPAPSEGGATGPAISSSSAGYGAGDKMKATTEGGKTGTMSNLRRVVIPVALNGAREEPMVLNSQGDAVFVTSRMAKALGLTPVARGAYAGAGASDAVPCDVVLLKEIRIAGLSFSNVPAKVIDPKTDFWKETAGIIPLWLLRRHGLMYDRRGGKLTLLPAGTSPETAMGEGCFRLKNQWWEGAPYLETTLQGKPGSFLLMDICLPSTYLSEEDLPLLGLTVNVTRYGHRQEVGLFGVYSYGVAEHASLGLGPNTIDMAGIRAAEIAGGLAVWSFGALGRETLDLFQVYVDYSSNVVAMKGIVK